MNFLARRDLNLKYFTTLFIGGEAKIAFFPFNKDGIKTIFHKIKTEYKLPYFVLGKGSNVAIQDGHLEFAAVLTNYLSEYSIDKEKKEVIAEAGVAMSFLASEALKKYQLGNLEWTYGLPGSIGGGIFMNARAYEKEFSQIVKWVEVYDVENEEFKTLNLEECQYAYKDSVFQHKPYFVYRVCLQLEAVPDAELEAKIKAMKNIRLGRVEKGQFIYPSCGSCFKNEWYSGVSSGQMLDEMNFKGNFYKDVKISEHHANFFVNSNHKAKYDDYVEFISQIEKAVLEKKGINLHREIRFLPDERVN